MSAFVVSKEHIDYLVHAARMDGYYPGCSAVDYAYGTEDQLNPRTNADAIGRALWAENVRSVMHRYPDATPDRVPGHCDMDHESVTMYRCSPLTAPIVPVAVLKALDCYEYQSCEHDGWVTSHAKEFCDDLRGRMISELPGYDDAPWEITAERQPTRQAA